MISNLSNANVLITGGTGFIGQQLVGSLVKHGACVTVLSRHAQQDGNTKSYKAVRGDLTLPLTFEGICRDIDIVFHLSGHAHALDSLDSKSDKINWQVTVAGTAALLEQAIQAGVSRFLFFSSVKVMGEGSEACLDETATCEPTTSYGKAKLAAEKLVIEANNRSISSTVLRLPMVYGPGCKGNLPRMIRAVAQGHFPPLPNMRNRRSLVDVRDVVQAAILAATDAAAIGKTYIVTDGEIYSTRQIYEWICVALDRQIPRWTIPLFVLRSVARAGDLVGRLRGRRFILDSASMDKLIGSACYSSEKISQELSYRPIYFLRDSLKEMVAEFKSKT